MRLYVPPCSLCLLCGSLCLPCGSPCPSLCFLNSLHYLVTVADNLPISRQYHKGFMEWLNRLR